ncbi:MAG TPA: class I SAM-dependent methyltransferase [Solirubrobacteraceae bacterium]|nr:class I SAM-dependent methyltransferase [Solirubrobacteraceae bacterium]
MPLPDGPKLDLAAGTGKLTRILAPPVYAVEPSAEMLDRLREEAPHAEALLGHAEAIPLPDGAVEAVLVAEAFHWFADETAVAEIVRVLRPGGLLVLLWNIPLRLPALDLDLPKATFSAWETRDSGVWREPLRGRFDEPRVVSVEHELRLDADGWRAHVGSWSAVALLPEAERRAALDSLGDEDVVIRMRAEAWWCRRDP